jgi:hypothetical protein
MDFHRRKPVPMKNYTMLVFFLCFGSIHVSAQFLDGKKNLQKFDGFFDFHYSETEGEIYLEVDKLNTDFLYVHSLSTGLGSNDIGLDRGQLGDGVIVRFVKSGNTLLLIQQNVQYRANTDNKLEKKSIEQAFARSVLFGFEIKETKEKKYIIDVTPFLLLDAHGVAENLKKNKEGIYKLDKTRNTLWMEHTKAFPKNVEFEALLTFVGEPIGPNLKSVVPDANSVSVIQHHSFVELPDNNYKPREFDPRCGSYPMSYMDYSTPIWEPITKRFITRHHLEKKDPNSVLSEAKEPIIYYLDPGTPEPVRSALLEGAIWWNKAYEAIGYKDAFQVRLLPEDADPMDLRYNVIQWVHRSTRGWSYGSTITDPRTGEILKGHVSLGSLRIRQDFLIAQALMNKPFAERDDNYQSMLEMALARIRQLAAHEVGHTLGFAHNFAASTNDRASVMDYPHPTLTLKNGEVDFGDAYATGVGEWDKITVAYSYGDVPNDVSEEVALNSILEGAFAKGLRYITDSDARSQSGAHSKAHLWDNGKSASEELESLLKLRETAIANFSQDNIRTGEPYSVLEDVFVPLYFYHRFQTEAAVKSIGGLDYSYAIKGYNGAVVQTLPKKEQEEALASVLKTLEINILMIPEKQLHLFPPRAFGYERTRESFKSNNGVGFDALGAVATASSMTLSLLLHPERANRLIQQKALDPKNIGLEEVLEQLNDAIFSNKKGDAYEQEAQRTIQFVALQYELNLYFSDKTIPQVKGIAKKTITKLTEKLSKDGDEFYKYLIEDALKYEKFPKKFNVFETPKIPDGSPIGSFECYYH